MRLDYQWHTDITDEQNQTFFHSSFRNSNLFLDYEGWDLEAWYDEQMSMLTSTFNYICKLLTPTFLFLSEIKSHHSE